MSLVANAGYVAFTVALPLFSFGIELFNEQKPKTTVCTVTINSRDEKEKFQSWLDPMKFNFVELVPDGDRNPDHDDRWFETACHNQIQCDVLIISGHFGGVFFGYFQKHFLSLETMDENACHRSCPGILDRPKEVFLFGCNTLADKRLDSRSPAEYYQMLIDDGFDPFLAQRNVESRYGIGTSFMERMAEAFSSVPHIYGFSSTSDRGPKLAQHLDAYLKDVGDYEDHLTHLKGPNYKLARAFHGTSMVEIKGAAFKKVKDQTFATFCQIRDENKSVLERLDVVKQMVSDPKLPDYVPTILSFLKRHPRESFQPEEEKVFESISKNVRSKTFALQNMRRIASPGFMFEYLSFLMELGWLSVDEFNFLSRKEVYKVLTGSLGVSVVDILCSAKLKQRGLLIHREDIPDSAFKEPYGIQAIWQCLQPSDSATLISIAKVAILGEGLACFEADKVLMDLQPHDPLLINTLIHFMEDPLTVGEVSSLLAPILRISDEEQILRIKKLADSGKNPLVQEKARELLENLFTKESR